MSHQTQRGCLLLQLPAELRIRIYNQLWPEIKHLDVICGTCSAQSRHAPSSRFSRPYLINRGDRPRKQLSGGLALLRTSRALHDEAVHELYGHMTFTFEGLDNTNMAYEAWPVMRYMQRLKLWIWDEQLDTLAYSLAQLSKVIEKTGGEAVLHMVEVRLGSTMCSTQTSQGKFRLDVLLPARGNLDKRLPKTDSAALQALRDAAYRAIDADVAIAQSRAQCEVC